MPPQDPPSEGPAPDDAVPKDGGAKDSVPKNGIPGDDAAAAASSDLHGRLDDLGRQIGAARSQADARQSQGSGGGRRGSQAPLVALLLIVLVGLVVDVLALAGDDGADDVASDVGTGASSTVVGQVPTTPTTSEAPSSTEASTTSEAPTTETAPAPTEAPATTEAPMTAPSTTAPPTTEAPSTTTPPTSAPPTTEAPSTTSPPTTEAPPTTTPPAPPTAPPVEVPSEPSESDDMNTIGEAVSVVAVAGDSMWSIASDVVEDRLGRAPTVGEIGEVWDLVLQANADNLPEPGNPDLIFVGQTIVVPASSAP